MSFPTSKPNQAQKTTSSHSQDEANNEKRIERLFLRLAAIYGGLWGGTYKTESYIQTSKQEWRAALKSFDNITVGKAIEHCREHVNYPPSLPMFIEICKSILKRETGFIQKDEQATSNPTVARQHLAALKTHLNNQP